ncbi:MAG: hypothetical protein CMB99_12505 [Flavobacteriaceae bacterium]|nr:hypothetical protein [Flavobacteriaceae bacterium]|tara:strand:+ start:40724 stop:41203 length:480 start_codon:yes stop_codon:yes gene_type:complete
MKTATIKQLKDELQHKSPTELKELCLSLGRFKKENKELLTYLLFEAHDEEAFIEKVQSQITESFLEINTKNYYYIRKSVRKILSQTKKFIRYSKKKDTQVQLLLHFCNELKEMEPDYKKSNRLRNVFLTQLNLIEKTIATLHPDLQYDYFIELENLNAE